MLHHLQSIRAGSEAQSPFSKPFSYHFDLFCQPAPGSASLSEGSEGPSSTPRTPALGWFLKASILSMSLNPCLAEVMAEMGLRTKAWECPFLVLINIYPIGELGIPPLMLLVNSVHCFWLWVLLLLLFIYFIETGFLCIGLTVLELTL